MRHDPEQGIKVIYENYSHALYGILMNILNEKELAEDVLQEVFLKIYSSFGTYEASRGRLFTWMLNIARNLAIDKLRSKDYKQTQKNSELSKHVYQIDHRSNQNLNPDLIGLRELTNSLKPEQKELIDLVYFSGYTQAEAADKLSIPLGTVKSRIRAAILKLRNIFGKA